VNLIASYRFLQINLYQIPQEIAGDYFARTTIKNSYGKNFKKIGEGKSGGYPLKKMY